MAEAVALPVRGTVDSDGRLATADPPLAQLQQEAGAGLGAPLAIPQLAALVRLARSLGVTLSRPALAGRADAELDLWVRAEPSASEVRLVIERWTERPAPSARPSDDLPEPAAAAARLDWTFEMDAQLHVTSLGRELASALGITARAAGGTPLTRLMQLEPDGEGELPLLKALATHGAFEDQSVQSRRGGGRLLVSGEPLLAADGSLAGYRGTARPAGPQHSRPAPMRAAWDELLRQPLDIIMSEAEQISGRGQGPLRSDYAAYASDIAGAARHLLDVLRSMGEDQPVGEELAEPIDLAALAAEAAGLVQAQAAEAGVSLELEGATGLPALGQPRAVTQILVNLIGNAVRYSPRGGVVRIEATPGEAAAVSVGDQGPGVAAKDRERIFERFEQAGSKGEGAGLGLAISRRLARSMGGDISLDSTPGKGARFTLTLPPR